ncbi:MAG: hypothetical protein H6677_17070 [Candidatus Obscuribacterales bacterium]|nr:hypothetical protein [Candidatus Obscuribacterales bacterium]
MLLKFAGRTLTIQAVLWVVILLSGTWLVLLLNCAKTVACSIIYDVDSKELSYLPLFTFGAIVLPAFCLLEFWPRKNSKLRWMRPRLTFPEIMMHTTIFLGVMGFWSGVLR